MGPIFSEYIFVRFFQRDGETTNDDRYWAPDKFSELLLQLRYYIAPEVAAIPDGLDTLCLCWLFLRNDNVISIIFINISFSCIIMAY